MNWWGSSGFPVYNGRKIITTRMTAAYGSHSFRCQAFLRPTSHRTSGRRLNTMSSQLAKVPNILVQEA